MDQQSEIAPVTTANFAGKKIWITGHKGMLGSAVVRSLAGEDADVLLTSRAELDLSDQAAVLKWMDENRPQLVFHIAAKVGGIHANVTQPAAFIHDNLMIQSNVIDGAYRVGVEKLVFVATNCTYPTRAQQPISEDALLTGALDESVRAYAVGKIAGIEMCRAYRKQYGCDFVSVIPPNLYGPGDNYHPQHGHVVAGILRRTHEAKANGEAEFVVWGDGTPRRELLFVDDLADAMKCIMRARTTHDLYNIGCDYDLAISEIAALVAQVVGFEGKIIYDATKPNGTMRKLLDSSRMRSLGWAPKIDVESGLRVAYRDFLKMLQGLDQGARL
jgi:GDP-L-fucose synthase